jgi:hypothetical protein
MQDAPILASVVADWQPLTARYTDDEFRLIVEFYGQMEQVIRTSYPRA